MPALSLKAGKNSLGGPHGATVPETVRAVEKMEGKGSTVTGVNDWLSFDDIKQALRSGHAVSVGLLYNSLGKFLSADYYNHPSRFLNKDGSVNFVHHQVVVIGYSQQRNQWTILDPLRHDPETKIVPIDANVFENAVNTFTKAGNNGYAQAWYFK